MSTSTNLCAGTVTVKLILSGWFVAPGRRTLTLNSFFVRAESMLDPLSRFVRKSLRNGFGQFVRMVVGGIAQKSDLLSVTATPFTEQEMSTQAKLLAQGKFSVECLRLQTGRRFAAR